MIDYADKLFEKYIERKPRCEAVRLTYENVWDVAQFLMSMGYQVNVSTGTNGITLQGERDNTGFTASVEQADALVLSGGFDVSVVPGREFSHGWEKEL